MDDLRFHVIYFGSSASNDRRGFAAAFEESSFGIIGFLFGFYSLLWNE